MSLISNYFKISLFILFILLFLINCKSNEKPSNPTEPTHPTEPTEPSTVKHELEGIWIGYDKKDKLEFNIDRDGNITFSPIPFPVEGRISPCPYTYTGKIKTNSIVYPYTNKDVICDFLEIFGDGYGKFVFSDSSNCIAKYDRIDYYSSRYMNLTSVTVKFTKE